MTDQYLHGGCQCGDVLAKHGKCPRGFNALLLGPHLGHRNRRVIFQQFADGDAQRIEALFCCFAVDHSRD